MGRRSILLLAILLVVAAGGCRNGSAPPTAAPGITGVITQLETIQTGEVIGRILVEGDNQEPGAVSDKASVTITDDTVLIDIGGNPMEASGLEVGLAVSVWFDGAVAESYPVQGTAAFIRQLP